MNYALIDINNNGLVLNIIVWDGVTPWILPAGTQLVQVPDGIAIDILYTYDGTNFNAPGSSD